MKKITILRVFEERTFSDPNLTAENRVNTILVDGEKTDEELETIAKSYIFSYAGTTAAYKGYEKEIITLCSDGSALVGVNITYK